MAEVTVGRSSARTAGLILALLSGLSGSVRGQDTTAIRFSGDSVSVRFIETDIRAVIQAIGRYLPKPVLLGPIQPVRVTLETPGPVDRATLRVVAARPPGIPES